MGLGVGFSRTGVALLPVHGGGCVLVATAGAGSVSIPPDRSRNWFGNLLMTSAGGALAAAGGALGSAGGALEGRGEDADDAMMISKYSGSGKAMVRKGNAVLLAGVVL